MGQSGNFGSGLLIGTLMGSLIGGVVGVLLASRLNGEAEEESPNGELSEAHPRRRLREGLGRNDEATRRSLEEKIAQLTVEMDDMRQQISGIRQNAVVEEGDRPLNQEL